MPYRTVTLPDGRVVKARVSDEAIASWWQTRQRSVNKGNFDRPPDIDTPTMRLWIARPGEEGYTERLIDRNQAALNVESHGDFPVYIVSAVVAGVIQQLHVDWRSDKMAYQVRLKIDALDDGRTVAGQVWLVPGDADVQTLILLALDTFWGAQLLAFVNHGEAPKDWLETTYEDFESYEAERALADAESDAEFGRMVMPDMPREPVH